MSKVFQCHHVDSERQYVITANKGLHRFPVVASVKSKDMYRKGLQKNHKDLVIMSDVMSSLTILLNSLYYADLLTEGRFKQALAAYQPFTEGYVEYTMLLPFLDQEGL